MKEEQEPEPELENQSEENVQKQFTDKGLNKALAILFVFAIYFMIFLKILFLQ